MGLASDRIPFKVQACSSEVCRTRAARNTCHTAAIMHGISPQEAFHPAHQLVQGTPNSSGWQTAKYVGRNRGLQYNTTNRGCTYPQHLILDLSQPHQLSQIQLLSHEHKVHLLCQHTHTHLQLCLLVPDPKPRGGGGGHARP